MKRNKLVFTFSLLIIAAALLGVIGVSALSGYSLDWWTIDGGGVTVITGGSYSLGGSLGQPDAGISSGGPYTLSGGFWNGELATTSHQIFLPLILR